MHPAFGVITFLLIWSICTLWMISFFDTPITIDRAFSFSVQSCLCIFCIIICPLLLLVDYGDVLLIVILLSIIVSLIVWVLWPILF